MLKLNWIKCHGGNWCSFLDVDITSSHFDDLAGVYVIFYLDPRTTTVKIGQGLIKDHIDNHRDDPEITKYMMNALVVTWAKLAPPDRNGVIAYLAERLKPIVSEKFLHNQPIPVNLPFDITDN